MGIVNHTLHKMLKTRGGLISPEEPQFITDQNVLQIGFLIEAYCKVVRPERFGSLRSPGDGQIASGYNLEPNVREKF